MSEIFERIKSSYSARTADTGEQKKLWFELSEEFKPDLNLYTAERPSQLIAGETGDLALSVLWIVQSALITPIFKEITAASGPGSSLSALINNKGRSGICALAHSEDPKAPVILTSGEGNYFLNGEKKFITAGENASLIIVSCRLDGDDKISRIAIIDTSELPENSLPALNLGIMKSVSHTKLILNNTPVKSYQVPQIDPSKVRRMIKKYGILERSLILEAYLSYLLYARDIINRSGGDIPINDNVPSLINVQSVSVAKQVNEAFNSDRIDTPNIPLTELFPLINIFKEAYIKAETRISETEKIKLKDLFLFDSLKG